MGKILVSIGAILAICAAAACGSTGGKSHAAAAASQSTTAASTPPASPSNSAPSLSRGTQAFVNQIRSGLGRPGYSNSGTDAQVASVGTQICNAREQGNTQAETISASHSVRTQWELSPKAVVRAAEKNICPSYVPKPPPKPKVVARFNGSGIQNTHSFTVPDSWHLSWEYWGCAGGSGNFIVDQYNTDGSPDANGASVNELGSGRGPVATYIYGDAGRHYFSVDSECSWSLAVVTGGRQ
jgi:hypothetical protein